MKQIGTINNFPVVQKIENKYPYLSCHGESIPQFHLVNIVKIAMAYEKTFGVDQDGNRTTEHVLNDLLFGMTVDFNEILTIYNSL